MGTLSVRLRYRPIRVGWCVRQGNLDDIRRVLRLTHTLWGGRHNPVIPVGNREAAEQLLAVFRVDVLYPAADDQVLHQFIRTYSYLPWPNFNKELFVEGSSGPMATLLDIYHPVRHLAENLMGRNDRSVSATLYDWDAADPLADAFLATFGAYPARADIGRDYGEFVVRNLKGQRVHFEPAAPIPAKAISSLTPSAIAGLDLEWDRVPGGRNPGLYLGTAGDFTDLVNLWNLRAADIEVIFYDPRYDARLSDLKTSYLSALQGRRRDPDDWDDMVAVWSKTDDAVEGIDIGFRVLRCVLNDATWNGRNVKPPLMFIGDTKSVLASVTDGDPVPSIAFQIPGKPFFDDFDLLGQQAIVSISPLTDTVSNEGATFRAPYIPELNEYYGRQAFFRSNRVRSEVLGLGIVTDVMDQDLTVRSFPKRELVAKIFETFGMKAEQSQAGRIATRLIQQMGGFQRCGVFKIRGVRRLIEAYGPLQSFTWSNAVQVIGENYPATGQPNFGDYAELDLGPRDGGPLKPEHAFRYLIERGVFRVGLNLKCPHCELKFWLNLDELATEVRCELCGTKFNVTPQLCDRNWAYRRSGVFGKEDHQEGAVPVALTLQQLDTVLDGNSILVTSMNITPVTANVAACETDFVAVAEQGYAGPVQLAIGECKPGGPKGEITEEDVTKLMTVADAFPPRRVETYIVFSKAGEFSTEEVARCRKAQSPRRHRVILLSDRELEPYFVYERAEKEFDIRATAISLEDLARNTHHIYFEPRHKATPPAQ